jgi:hypothetical protein
MSISSGFTRRVDKERDEQIGLYPLLPTSYCRWKILGDPCQCDLHFLEAFKGYCPDLPQNYLKVVT